MDDDRATAPHLLGLNRIIKGTTVYDAAGEQIGSVHSYDPDDNRLVVQRGLLAHREVDVPADAIARVDADGVYLSLYHDALADERAATEQRTQREGLGERGSAPGSDLNQERDRQNPGRASAADRPAMNP